MAVALAVLLFAGAGWAASGVAYAQETPDASLTFVQMSDIHYFPLKYCYQDVNNENYETSEFYHSTTGDTKLVLESGVILNNAVTQIIKKVKEDAQKGTAPMYFLATGDLCKNGEREALIDVANALRYMQNEIRKENGYENFQVLAQVGNHDLYNTDAALYSETDGKELIADTVTAAQFALIFAGLGFPNANIGGTDGAFDLTTYLPAEYWYSEYVSEYQYSPLAQNITVNYYSQALRDVVGASTSEQKLQNYFKIGDGINQLSYTVEINSGKYSDYGFIILDSADREATDEGKPVRVSEEEYTYLKDVKQEKQTYFAGTEDGSIDFDSPIDSEEAERLFSQNKAVYRATKYAHITGGRLTEGLLNWAQDFAEKQHKKATKGKEKTLFAAFHHNLLPHFDSEDDILKDFTLYNWEYAAKRFLDMGVRYVFTGHQHSSDIASYTDVEGRTIYDTETGSMVSYESPRRYVTVSRYIDANNSLSESMTSSIFATDSMKKIASSHIDQNNMWDQKSYEQALKVYNAAPTPENWQAVIDSNPNFLAYIVAHDRLSTRNYNEYIGEEIYTQLVDRVLNHFLTEDTVDGLLDTVDNLLANLDLGSIGSAINTVTGFSFGESGTIRGIAKYLLNDIVNNLYADGNYPYNGKTYNGIVPYLRAIIDDLVNMEFGDSSLAPEDGKNPANSGKMTLKEMAGFIMMAHATGTEVKLATTDEELKAEYKAIDAADFKDLDASVGEFAFKNPIDKTYRKRMTAALKDAHEQLISGKFAGDLLDALLDPLYKNEDSLLKTLLTKHYDIQKVRDAGYITPQQCENIITRMKDKFPKNWKDITTLLGVEVESGATVSAIDMTDFTFEGIINMLLPVAKPIVANMIGFNLSGENLFEIIDNALAGYVTDSFLVGLGGIADEIVVSYATDSFPDIQDMKNASMPFLVQPYKGYTEGRTYDSTKVTPSTVGAAFNAATQENGRVPSRLTANFDTADSTGSYTFKFYTDEEIYANFKYKTTENGDWISLATSKAKAKADADYFDSSVEATKDGITVKMLTQTRPAYVPLIDLGLACLTHGEIVNEIGDDEIPILYGKNENDDGYWRDSAASNSVIYKNVTTVTVSGLKPNTTYFYDIEGVYVAGDDKESKFSLVENAGKEFYTFTTAADETVTDFEFLTIADIQGMIQSMYDDSHKAVEALLKDSRTKNFDFLLNAGDMVDNGKNFRQWGMALNTYEDLFASTSQFFTAGNHEDGKNAFATYFNYTLPTDEQGKQLQKDITDGAFYSFDYGNSHFTILNTNDASGTGLGKEQLSWLKDDLKAAQDKQWRFVLMHKSLFSGGSHSYDGEVVAMREQLVPIFKENNVNIVFAGHDHTYTTTKLIKEDGTVVDKPSLNGTRYCGDGVMYVTLGTLGTKFYTYGENKNVTPKFDKKNSVLRTLTSQTFGKVTVSADEIVFTGYIYNPETDKIEVIGKPMALTTESVIEASTVYTIIGVFAGVIVIVAVALIIIALKKKKSQKPADGSTPTSGETSDGIEELTSADEQPVQAEAPALTPIEEAPLQEIETLEPVEGGPSPEAKSEE